VVGSLIAKNPVMAGTSLVILIVSVEAEGAVELELFGGETGEHVVVAATVGFGDEGAEFALTAFELTMFEGVERVLDLLGHGEGRGGGVFGFVEGAGE
jgi:hypothetical protein